MSFWDRVAPRLRTARRRAGRYLSALAVTLPLGLDPHVVAGGALPRATLPNELFAEPNALGAIGVVWAEGRVCAAVGLRQSARTPTVRHLHWRPSAAPAQATVLPLERLARGESPEGYEIWSGCASAPEPRAGAALSTLLLDPPLVHGQRRRIDLPTLQKGSWNWRLIHPLESSIEMLPADSAPERAEGVERARHRGPDGAHITASGGH
jgi:hypothetical protein